MEVPFKNSDNTLDTTRFAPLTILSLSLPTAIARLRGDKRNDFSLGNSFRLNHLSPPPNPALSPRRSHFSTTVDELAELSVWHRFRGNRRWDDVDLFRSSVNGDPFCGELMRSQERTSRGRISQHRGFEGKRFLVCFGIASNNFESL